MQIINYDLLKTQSKYIAHQCNCNSRGAKGLAKQIFEKYPYANTYDREREPGTIEVCYSFGDPTIINMYAQKYPGRHGNPSDHIETRQMWFENCLRETADVLKKDNGYRFLALPYRIGRRGLGNLRRDEFGLSITLYRRVE